MSTMFKLAWTAGMSCCVLLMVVGCKKSTSFNPKPQQVDEKVIRVLLPGASGAPSSDRRDVDGGHLYVRVINPDGVTIDAISHAGHCAHPSHPENWSSAKWSSVLGRR